VCGLRALSQPVDWTGDMTLFGTAGNESLPAMSARPASARLHAFCVCGVTLCSKTSNNAGADWSVCDTMNGTISEPRVEATADGQYDYAFVTGASDVKTLYRFAGSQNSWQGALLRAVAAGCTGTVQCAAISTDALAPSSDSLVGICWLERQPDTDLYSLWFVRSHDLGNTFEPEQPLAAFESPDAQLQKVGITVSWLGSAARWIVAAPIHRAGSIPEEIRVFTSDDQGATWGDSTEVDNATFAQREVSLAAYEQTVMLVYSRRINAGTQRDIFLSYSPDGGLHFSPPIAVTDSLADEHDPRVVISDDGATCSIVYLADNSVDLPATVYLRQCAVATPWEIGVPLMISEAGGATRDGGLCAAATGFGPAVAWTSQFPTGDTDVKFDAEWRGEDTPGRIAVLPDRSFIGQNYPNPFNGFTVVPLTLDRGRSVTLSVYDVTGRMVMSRDVGYLGAGSHRIPLELTGLPSGAYWTRMESAAPARTMILLK